MLKLYKVDLSITYVICEEPKSSLSDHNESNNCQKSTKYKMCKHSENKFQDIVSLATG